MWLSVTLTAEAIRAEALSEALMDAGALSVSIEDADAGTELEKPQFGEPGYVNERLWDHSKVIALFDRQIDLAAALAEAAGAVGLDAVPEFSIEEIAEQNWVQLTQSQFEPIHIDDRLWIVPSWHDAPNRDAINIEMDPGMAFGTGSHPTTRLCLQWLLDAVKPGDSVLDYGCGSGILGIAAAKLGAASVLGVDIDEHAVTASRANAERNGITTEHAKWMSSAQQLAGQYDLVVANILTNPLCVLAPGIAARVASGGRLALSGVLAAQAEQVIAAYAPWIALNVGAEHDGWIRLEGRMVKRLGERSLLITRCPNCATTFRVRMEQLNLRGGRVRCGHCHVPFSALASLEELPDETALSSVTPPERASAQAQPAVPAFVSTPDPAPPVPLPPAAAEFPDNGPIKLPPAPSPEPREEADSQGQAFAAATQIVLDEHTVGAGLDFDVDDLSPPADAEPATATHSDIPPAETPQEFIELGSAADDADDIDDELQTDVTQDTEQDDTLIPDYATEGDGDGVPQLHTVFLEEDIPPGTGADPALAATRAKTRRTLILGNALLLLTGILLSTYVLRIELMRYYPELRAPLEQICQHFSCDVPYPRDADEVLLVGSDLTQTNDPKAGYHLAVTVRNHAHYPVAWPQLEITLTDRFERALTRRVLEPQEWLPANLAQRPAFEAQGELTAQITLSSDSQVMGYRLGVFYR